MLKVFTTLLSTGLVKDLGCIQPDVVSQFSVASIDQCATKCASLALEPQCRVFTFRGESVLPSDDVFGSPNCLCHDSSNLVPPKSKIFDTTGILHPILSTPTQGALETLADISNVASDEEKLSKCPEGHEQAMEILSDVFLAHNRKMQRHDETAINIPQEHSDEPEILPIKNSKSNRFAVKTDKSWLADKDEVDPHITSSRAAKNQFAVKTSRSWLADKDEVIVEKSTRPRINRFAFKADKSWLADKDETATPPRINRFAFKADKSWLAAKDETATPPRINRFAFKADKSWLADKDETATPPRINRFAFKADKSWLADKEVKDEAIVENETPPHITSRFAVKTDKSWLADKDEVIVKNGTPPQISSRFAVKTDKSWLADKGEVIVENETSPHLTSSRGRGVLVGSKVAYFEGSAAEEILPTTEPNEAGGAPFATQTSFVEPDNSAEDAVGNGMASQELEISGPTPTIDLANLEMPKRRRRPLFSLATNPDKKRIMNVEDNAVLPILGSKRNRVVDETDKPIKKVRFADKDKVVTEIESPPKDAIENGKESQESDISGSIPVPSEIPKTRKRPLFYPPTDSDQLEKKRKVDVSEEDEQPTAVLPTTATEASIDSEDTFFDSEEDIFHDSQDSLHEHSNEAEILPIKNFEGAGKPTKEVRFADKHEIIVENESPPKDAVENLISQESEISGPTPTIDLANLEIPKRRRRPLFYPAKSLDKMRTINVDKENPSPDNAELSILGSKRTRIADETNKPTKKARLVDNDEVIAEKESPKQIITTPSSGSSVASKVEYFEGLSGIPEFPNNPSSKAPLSTIPQTSLVEPDNLAKEAIESEKEPEVSDPSPTIDPANPETPATNPEQTEEKINIDKEDELLTAALPATITGESIDSEDVFFDSEEDIFHDSLDTQNLLYEHPNESEILPKKNSNNGNEFAGKPIKKVRLFDNDGDHGVVIEKESPPHIITTPSRSSSGVASKVGFYEGLSTKKELPKEELPSIQPELLVEPESSIEGGRGSEISGSSPKIDLANPEIPKRRRRPLFYPATNPEQSEEKRKVSVDKEDEQPTAVLPTTITGVPIDSEGIFFDSDEDIFHDSLDTQDLLYEHSNESEIVPMKNSNNGNEFAGKPIKEVRLFDNDGDHGVVVEKESPPHIITTPSRSISGVASKVRFYEGLSTKKELPKEELPSIQPELLVEPESSIEGGRGSEISGSSPKIDLADQGIPKRRKRPIIYPAKTPEQSEKEREIEVGSPSMLANIIDRNEHESSSVLHNPSSVSSSTSKPRVSKTGKLDENNEQSDKSSKAQAKDVEPDEESGSRGPVIENPKNSITVRKVEGKVSIAERITDYENAMGVNNAAVGKFVGSSALILVVSFIII